MEEKRYELVGKVLKPHGLTGELKVELMYSLRNARQLPGHFYVRKSTELLPFFVQGLKETVAAPLLRLEGVADRTQAEELAGAKLYLLPEEIEAWFEPAAEGPKRYVGFQAVDDQTGALGEISDILDLPAHPTCVVAHSSGKDVLIPFIDDYILSVDTDKREIRFSVPDGLIDLYIQG